MPGFAFSYSISKPVPVVWVMWMEGHISGVVLCFCYPTVGAFVVQVINLRSGDAEDFASGISGTGSFYPADMRSLWLRGAGGTHCWMAMCGADKR